MTEDDVRDAIAEIVAKTGDDEAQHSMEDDLYQRVLGFISEGDGASLHVRLARAALATRDLDFCRWYA